MIWSKDVIKSVSESGNFSTTAAHLQLTIASTYQDAEVPYNKPFPVTLSFSLNENSYMFCKIFCVIFKYSTEEVSLVVGWEANGFLMQGGLKDWK